MDLVMIEATLSITEIQGMGRTLTSTLGLTGSAVGVRLLTAGVEAPAEAEPLLRHRYCQAVMKARHGQHVLLDGKGIACPAAAAAFGFKPLPEGLRNGKGLVGFGIVPDAATGQRMFANMPRLAAASVTQLHLFPLDEALNTPDIVVIEDQVEKLMWISLAYLNLTGGERVHSSTAVLQAACVDSTIIPYLEGRLNQGYGCYGCREATDLQPGESVLGFPGAMLPSIMMHLEYLAQKAMPKSRAKKAWSHLDNEMELA
jgi:uncharacterized protein (DUF169 family)